MRRRRWWTGRSWELQQGCRLVEAEECFRNAFWEDVRPLIREWRASRGLAENPLQALRESGYVERITRERASRNASAVSSYASAISSLSI